MCVCCLGEQHEPCLPQLDLDLSLPDRQVLRTCKQSSRFLIESILPATTSLLGLIKGVPATTEYDGFQVILSGSGSGSSRRPFEAEDALASLKEQSSKVHLNPMCRLQFRSLHSAQEDAIPCPWHCELVCLSRCIVNIAQFHEILPLEIEGEEVVVYIGFDQKSGHRQAAHLTPYGWAIDRDDRGSPADSGPPCRQQLLSAIKA